MFNKKRNQSFSGETVLMGQYIHSCGNLIVIKLQSKGIPYPNSPVIVDKRQIGKVDEIFGTLEEPFAAIETEHSKLHKKGQIFEGYKEKFIYKDKFMARDEYEKKKIIKDKEKGKKKKEGKTINFKGNKKFKSKKERFSKIKKSMNEKSKK
ncbi:hypothetical protein NUSPORA_00385 [Nucleospora cyclopteri]